MEKIRKAIKIVEKELKMNFKDLKVLRTFLGNNFLSKANCHQ